MHTHGGVMLKIGLIICAALILFKTPLRAGHSVLQDNVPDDTSQIVLAKASTSQEYPKSIEKTEDP